MRTIWRLLPGPLPARIGLAVVLAVVFLVVLFYFYEWLGSTFLDTGGTVG